MKVVEQGDGRAYLIRPDWIPGKAVEGAEYDGEKLKPLRNRPVAVHHIPELLVLWGAKGVVEKAEADSPLRRAFQQILMKKVGQHDFSKQECAHILNGIEFVELSKDCVMQGQCHEHAST